MVSPGDPRGDPAAGPSEFVDWLVDSAFLRRPADEAHLRDGLALAGLPPAADASGAPDR